ncbi:MAG TPA: hypothetical protein RMH99_22450 [Sandaracinaceae bacterium LLY-WYZ-13_1]|nr:hypothetical protein [Sandaracinaceae bacterium LLY-WYZ-13_1]
MRRFCMLAAPLALGALLGGCSVEVDDDVGCISDADCFEDEICDVDGFCVPDDTYLACGTTADCLDTRDQCWEVDVPAAGTLGNYCSNECIDDLDCQSANGFGGVCYAVGGDPTTLCYQQCDFDGDCYSGSVCVEVDLGGGVFDLICLPNN